MALWIGSSIRESGDYYNEEKQTQNMKKTIEMSLETARQLIEYAKGLGVAIIKVLKENFTKEELEGNKGYTWEESYGCCGYYISASDSSIISLSSSDNDKTHKNVFKTEKQALSALAFAQLSHIVDKYNEGKGVKIENDVCVYYYIQAYNFDKVGLDIIRTAYNSCILPRQFFLFHAKEDAETSLEVNRQLWEQYWMA